MKRKVFVALAAAVAVCLIALVAGSSEAHAAEHSVTYVAHLHALNSNAAGGHARGVARFTIHGDSLTIRVDMHGVPPGIMHMQHIHGFTNGNAAACPAATADVNHDGFIDLDETEPASGTTMVPLTADPVNMKIASDTYPKASTSGTYQYKVTVPLKALEAAFAKSFPGQKLDLARRVVYIHGVLPTTKLPSSVASLGTVPAQVTLPIACGKIERVSR